MQHREKTAACSDMRTKHINNINGQNVEFLGAFEKLQKGAISFVVYIRPSIPPQGKTRLPLDGVP
jgi:hypothetical protein